MEGGIKPGMQEGQPTFQTTNGLFKESIDGTYVCACHH